MANRWLFLLIVACFGCSQSAPSTDVTVADSAGVTIVTNGQQQLATASQWHLEPSPSLSIQSDETEMTLFQVTDIVRTESGIIAAVNRGTDEVVLFDSRGEPVGRRGREGDGPGEFRRLSSVLSLGGDSIAAYDVSHKRLSVFGPSGALVREFTLEPPPGDSDYERLLNLASDGFAVFTGGGLRGGGPGVFRSMSESFSVNRDGDRVGSFGEFPGAEVFIDQVAGSILFGASSYAAVVGGELVVGTAEDPELRFYTDDEGLRRIVRWPDHDRRVTEERVEQYMTAAEASMPEAARPQARAMFAMIPRSERQPAFEDILADSGGELWVGGYRGPEMALPGARSPARDWLVFDDSGVLKALIPTPIGFQPLYLGTNEVIGVFIDELGVESIQVYEVVREQM